MEYYKIRIDTVERQLVEKFILRYSTSYLYCFENQGTDNPHCHMYIETTQKQATIRNHIRKTFGGGNGIYSMKELDSEKPIEYLAYCCKEKDYFHNLPEDIVEKAVAYDDKIKEEMKDKKANRKTILQKMELEFNYEGKDIWPNKITEDVVEYYKKNEILVREFQMISQVQTLMLKYCSGYDNTLVQRINKRILDL